MEDSGIDTTDNESTSNSFTVTTTTTTATTTTSSTSSCDIITGTATTTASAVSSNTIAMTARDATTNVKKQQELSRRNLFIDDSDEETGSEEETLFQSTKRKSVQNKSTISSFTAGSSASRQVVKSASIQDDQPMVHQPMSRLSSSSRISKQSQMNGAYKPVANEESILVDVNMSDSDSEGDVPLRWQSSSRGMREQLLKDGFNLDLESDNEDLDLIPPKASYGAGICSCSNVNLKYLNEEHVGTS